MHLAAAIVAGGIARSRSEVPEGVVSPVILEAAIDEVALIDHLVDGHEFDGGDVEFLEVIDAGLMG